MAKKPKEKPDRVGSGGFKDLALAVNAPTDGDEATVRIAGGLQDMRLDVSPARAGKKKALRHMAKAINIAFQSDFLQNELEAAYEAARVNKETVEILHKDYVGLGDGVFATIGKSLKSVKLSFKGADPASPTGRRRRERGEGSVLGGLANLLGRKLNLIQEYEDKVPDYLGQMLDRLEASGMIIGWNRDEWSIETKTVGLDVVMVPVLPGPGEGEAAAEGSAEGAGKSPTEKVRKKKSSRAKTAKKEVARKKGVREKAAAKKAASKLAKKKRAKKSKS